MKAVKLNQAIEYSQVYLLSALHAMINAMQIGNEEEQMNEN